MRLASAYDDDVRPMTLTAREASLGETCHQSGPPRRRALHSAEMARFDCQTCGACCHNTAENIAAGRRDDAEVQKTDALLREPREVLRRLAIRNEDGVYHLRLVGDDQRCIALEGSGVAGSAVSCAIYALRPRGCRRVTAGDAECLRARVRVGLRV